jgi:excinuclease UvrABC ATPase subunit
MPSEEIRIQNARSHNLQGVSCRIPIARLSVVTGVSGSGKSTLAFDTLYAEGQRRYVTSLSAYARQFLERLPRPQVDFRAAQYRHQRALDGGHRHGDPGSSAPALCEDRRDALLR